MDIWRWAGPEAGTGLEVDDLGAAGVGTSAADGAGPAGPLPPADPQALDALLSLPLLVDARLEDVHRLAALAWCRRLGPGQVLFHAGQPTLELHVVHSGRLKLLVPSTRGDALLLDVVTAGEAVADPGVVDGGLRATTAVALDRADVWCVPAAAVRGLVEESRAVAVRFAEDLAAKLRSLTAVTADLVLLDLPHRLAKLLAADGSDVSRMPQSDLAARLGVTRQSLNRSLHRLQDEGWVSVRRGSIEVLDRDALDRFSSS